MMVLHAALSIIHRATLILAAAEVILRQVHHRAVAAQRLVHLAAAEVEAALAAEDLPAAEVVEEVLVAAGAAVAEEANKNYQAHVMHNVLTWVFFNY